LRRLVLRYEDVIKDRVTQALSVLINNLQRLAPVSFQSENITKTKTKTLHFLLHQSEMGDAWA